MKKMEQKL